MKHHILHQWAAGPFGNVLDFLIGGLHTIPIISIHRFYQYLSLGWQRYPSLETSTHSFISWSWKKPRAGFTTELLWAKWWAICRVLGDDVDFQQKRSGGTFCAVTVGIILPSPCVEWNIWPVAWFLPSKNGLISMRWRSVKEFNHEDYKIDLFFFFFISCDQSLNTHWWVLFDLLPKRWLGQ